MTSKSVFTCLFLICVISSTKEQFVASYLTPHANRWNQYTGSAFHGQISALSSQLRANNEYEPSTHVFDQFETIRKKTFSAILLSFMISSISEMTLIGGYFINEVTILLFNISVRILNLFSDRFLFWQLLQRQRFQ